MWLKQISFGWVKTWSKKNHIFAVNVQKPCDPYWQSHSQEIPSWRILIVSSLQMSVPARPPISTKRVHTGQTIAG